MGLLATVLRSAGSMIGALMPVFRQRYAERSAGKAPTEVPSSIADDVLDAALARLGTLRPEDPLWKRCIVGLEATLVRPELFVQPSMREWLSQPQVRSGLKSAAEASLARSGVSQHVIDRLADEYAEATGEDRRFADHPIRIAIAFLKASVQGLIRDPGVATVVQAVGSDLGHKIGNIDARVADLAEQAGLSRNSLISERFTQEGRRDLENILRRRATQGQQTVADLRQLVSAFELGGRLAPVEASLKNEVNYWLARAEAAAGDASTAERLLAELERGGYAVAEVAWALVDLAGANPQGALRRVRNLPDADSRTAVFHILLKSEGPDAALQYVGDLTAADPDTFTAAGWNNICATLLTQQRVADAARALSHLPPALLSRCTHLYYMYAVSTLLPMLPPDRHASLMSYGFLAVAEHVLDGPESLKARSLAVEVTRLAMQCAVDSDDHVIAAQCAGGIRGLRLLDPASRVEEISLIAAEMGDGEKAVRLIALARAHSIGFDPAPLEAHLSHAQRLGGLNEQQLRAKLYLLDVPERCGDLVQFLDDEWATLLPDNNAEVLVAMKVQALARTKDIDGAIAFLDAHVRDVSEPVSSRLRLMIRDASGEDPTDAATELFKQSNAIEDLHNLVQVLVSRKAWQRLAPYAEQLFAREPNFDSAILRFKCLQRTKASAKEVRSFLEGSVGVVEQRPELRSARAWAHFEAGDHLAAKRLNDELLSERDDANDVALDVNVAIRTGDWERFPNLAARAWERRSKLNARMLLSLAQLVGFSDPTQALTLAQEAVSRDENNPAILVGANAVAIAARRDDLAMLWVHKAAELSKQGGPVSVFSYREMVEFMRSNAESWKQKNELYRTAQIPLHVAASLFNAPFSQLLIAVPRQNAQEVDPRRRQPVPIRSGARMPVAAHAFSRVGLDITSLFILSELGRLGDVLDSFEEVFVSPRVMDVLLDDRRRVAFHQPSRIAEVKPLSAWVAAGRLKVIESRAEADLMMEVGDEAAVLLSEAKARGGMFVHPGPLFKVASYMDEEASLGELQPLFADPIDVVGALCTEGVITQAASDEAKAGLQRIGMAGRQAVAPAVPLFLDGLAVRYLHQAKVLQSLLSSGHTVWIHRSTVDEWQALLGTEPMTEELTTAIDDIRQTVRTGLMSGKVKFLAESRKQRGGLSALTLLPMVDLLEDTAQVEVAVVDDRMLGSNAVLTDSAGRSIPLLSSLDLLDVLVEKGRLNEASRRESLHVLRSRCLFCVPIDPAELLFYLGQTTVVDGKLKETAELRTIRQYLARLNSTDVFCTPADLNYQDSLWRVASLVLGKIWQDGNVTASDASARSDWVVAHILPDPELAMRFAPDGESRIDQIAAAQLSVSLIPPGVDRQRRGEYSAWLERARLAPLLPNNSNVLDLAAEQAGRQLVERNSEMARELASRDRTRPAK